VPRARRNNSRKGTQASSLDGVLRFTNRPHSEEIASQAPPLSLFVSAGKRTYTRSYLYPEIAKTLTKLFGLGAAGCTPVTATHLLATATLTATATTATIIATIIATTATILATTTIATGIATKRNFGAASTPHRTPHV
jgi:hypothetical protein